MKNKIKNTILKCSAYLAAFTFFAAGSAIDTNSLIPAVMCFGAFAYLMLFAYANLIYHPAGDC